MRFRMNVLVRNLLLPKAAASNVVRPRRTPSRQRKGIAPDPSAPHCTKGLLSTGRHPPMLIAKQARRRGLFTPARPAFRGMHLVVSRLTAEGFFSPPP